MARGALHDPSVEMIRLCLCLVLVIMGGVAAPAVAAPGSCPDPTVSLIQASAECEWAYAEYQSVTSAATDHVWTTDRVCEVGSAARCDEFLSCTRDGVTAWMHQIYMDGIPVGQVCIPEAEEEIDVGRAAVRAFKRMNWPASDLVVQPPGGKTLVNFETNFYTLDDMPISQEVRIAGRQVAIRAVPTTYTFHFGDETSARTSSPGRPHPHLDVTHVYAQTGKVAVRLDTTYTGEYRIGRGEWVAIAETLTVRGADQDLQIVEALPQLVLQ